MDILMMFMLHIEGQMMNGPKYVGGFLNRATERFYNGTKHSYNTIGGARFRAAVVGLLDGCQRCDPSSSWGLWKYRDLMAWGFLSVFT